MVDQNIENKRTLKQLLLWFVGGVLVLLLLGNLLLNVSITKDYLANQLHSHAQDAATSLGLSLSTVVDARDEVMASRMIDAIFDSGDYRLIALKDVAGNGVVARSTGVKVGGVPEWFTDAIVLKTPVKDASVMAGWTQLGSIEVASHPGYAYLELWQVFKTQLSWFALVALLGLLLLRIFITFLLRPLSEIEEHAHQLSERKFDLRASIPKTRELGRVANAMNEMAQALGDVFGEQLNVIQNLRERSVIDELTGLNNREGFDRRLKAELESEQSLAQGALFLLKIKDFDEINLKIGRAEGDRLLKAFAQQLQPFLDHDVGSFAARRTGADFSLFLPSVSADTVDDVAGNMMSKLNGIAEFKSLLRDDLIHLGVACVQQGDSSSELLSKADMALRQAQTRTVSAWQRYAYISNDNIMQEVRQANEWQAILQKVLLDQSVALYVQPVFHINEQRLVYEQVLARVTVDGKLVAAGAFLPMVSRFGLNIPFDQMVIEKAVGYLEADDSERCLCISLSESSLADSGFLGWLEGRISALGDKARRLVFEVSEHILSYNEEALIAFCEIAKNFKFKLSIERFGASSVPFSYLQRVNVHAIKVDHSFIRDVHVHQDNQFFLQSAIQMAHSQALQIVAVGVESKEEWDCIHSLGMDCAMGYYLGRPTAIDSE